MTKLERAAAVAPFVRIGLYVVTGMFAGASWLDQETIDLIRMSPEVLAVLSGVVAGVWYGVAKWRGWKT